MESDAERGVGSSEYGGEELSLPLTIAKLNRGMDSIVAKAGTLPTLKNVAGITSFERKFKSALEATPLAAVWLRLTRLWLGLAPDTVRCASG